MRNNLCAWHRNIKNLSFFGSNSSSKIQVNIFFLIRETRPPIRNTKVNDLSPNSFWDQFSLIPHQLHFMFNLTLICRFFSHFIPNYLRNLSGSFWNLFLSFNHLKLSFCILIQLNVASEPAHYYVNTIINSQYPYTCLWFVILLSFHVFVRDPEIWFC